MTKEFNEPDDYLFIEKADNIDIRDEIKKYLIHWSWFLIGLCLAFLLGFLYLKYTPKQYSASAYIMIKDNLKSGISEEFKAVSDLGIVGNSSTNNPENEIFIIKSRKIVGKMVDSLNLNISYFKNADISNGESYKNSAIKLEFVNKNKGALHYSKDTSFTVSVLPNNELVLKNIDGDTLKHSRFKEIIRSKELGNFKIIKNENSILTNNVLVVIKSRKSVISSYASKIMITPMSDFSSILHLQVVDHNKFKAENILDELIKQYNHDAIIDKNIISRKTLAFLEARLEKLGGRLALIQDSLKTYKIENGISGNPIENQIVLETITENIGTKDKLITQLSIINWAEDQLNNLLVKNEILPVNLGFDDQNISNSIGEINKLLLQRKKILRFSGEKNPIILELNNRIKGLKQNLRSNLKNLKKSVEIRLNNTNIQNRKNQSKVASIPEIERGIVDTHRQKLIYSELYSYLLKKKEETAISLAITVPNAKIIDVAFSSGTPVSPNNKNIYLLSLGAGLLIPFILIYIRSSLDNKIHNRKDIEANLNIPYLGDIPHTEVIEKIIVKNETRTSSAEAFRILRTNLNFILPKSNTDTMGKVIFVTSTISGEGKSFVSLNLAASLALTNKKVLLIGLDLRAPKITEYLDVKDHKGVTNYILDEKINLDDIKFNVPQIKNVDFIASGVIPPNPSELLLNPRVEEILSTVKNDYDYIIADTAPVSLVTDTMLIAEMADVVLYVARANYIDRKMLIVPQTLYKEKKLPNMAIVLNDTDTNKGYGYGYGYVEQDKKTWYKRFLGL
ncbi:GumC family protein [Polaribacter sp. Asnod6-C07]|uniref:GumC family protein n=1 Tax=Polaribacter sp. Asnod6-C07 TaxID=3160582 RepID=UPI0038701A4C